VPRHFGSPRPVLCEQVTEKIHDDPQ
jgi:hypothetical protein